MSNMRHVGFPLVAMLIATATAGCEHVEEPWINNGAEWKQEKFETQASGPELRHRLEYTQVDR